MAKTKNTPHDDIGDDNEQIAPGVTRERLWGSYVLKGSKEDLLRAGLVALAWLPDGTLRNKKGQVRRTKSQTVSGRNIYVTVDPKWRVYQVSMEYTEAERVKEEPWLDAQRDRRERAMEERARIKRAADHKPINPKELKDKVAGCGDILLEQLICHADGSDERREFGMVTAKLPSDVVEKLIELKQMWISTVRNAEVIQIRQQRAHLSVVK